MKVKSLFLSIALLLVASGAGAADDNVSVVRPLAIKAGKTQKVAIALENAKSYTAFQMDIKLPEGLTLSNPKSLRTSDATFHNITAGEVDGVTRVVALSYKTEEDGKTILEGNGNKEFIDGNSEIILYFDITASDTYVDNGNIEVKNVKFVDSDGNTQAIADASSENGSVLGDVNSDKDVTAQDASLVLQGVANKITLTIKQKGVGNVNFDEDVTAQDASLILQKVAGKVDL